VNPSVFAEHNYETTIPQPPSRPRERGLISYSADVDMPLLEPPVRDGEVWHLRPEEGNTFQRARLLLHANGFAVRYPSSSGAASSEVSALAVSWSPFSLVQACRLHSVQADAQQPWLRLFKVSVFHHGVTHFFATQGAAADLDRARWVADVSRALRLLTQSLFPPFSLRAEPLPGAGWTAMRLLAGYLLLCDDRGVSLVYCELHAHWDGAAAFAAYEDEYCDVQVVRLSVDKDTCVSERVGIDCSCFSLGGHHFNTRSCAEKMLWLRAISNVKVKLRHRATNPTPTDLKHYRAAVLEYAASLPNNTKASSAVPSKPLLPHRGWRRSLVPAPSGSTVPLDGEPQGLAAVAPDGSQGSMASPGPAMELPRDSPPQGPGGGRMMGGPGTNSTMSSGIPVAPGSGHMGPRFGGSPLMGTGILPVGAAKPPEPDVSPSSGMAAFGFDPQGHDSPPSAPPAEWPSMPFADVPVSGEFSAEADVAAGTEPKLDPSASDVLPPVAGSAGGWLGKAEAAVGVGAPADRVASLPAGNGYDEVDQPNAIDANLRRAPSV